MTAQRAHKSCLALIGELAALVEWVRFDAARSTHKWYSATTTLSYSKYFIVFIHYLYANTRLGYSFFI